MRNLRYKKISFTKTRFIGLGIDWHIWDYDTENKIVLQLNLPFILITLAFYLKKAK